MPRGIVIPADEQAPLEVRDFGPTSDYQNAVGGWFEAVDLSESDASMYVHDEGKIIGLPVNRRATVLLWLHNRAFHGHDVLCGDVVLIGQPDDDEGATQDVPESFIQLLTQTDRFKIEVQLAGKPGVWTDMQVTYGSWADAYQIALSLFGGWITLGNVRVIAA